MATQTKTKPVDLQTVRPKLRRGALAYLGLYGLAYDRFQMRREQVKTIRADLFADLTEKGETTVKQAEVLLKNAQKGAWKNYADATEKLTEALPVKVKSRVEVLEDELTSLQETLERLTKTAASEAKKAKKKTTAKAKTAKAAPKKVAVKKDVVETAKPVVKTPAPVAPVAPVAEAAKTAEVKTPEVKTPRHIPYFLDVKRYDPLANEDVVRKIVNHCGIALRSEDARYVACSDEAERVTVRESWLKRKLALTATDTDLDKKVLEVCTLMQRDQKKNRVTFYYLLAKKERLLETL